MKDHSQSQPAPNAPAPDDDDAAASSSSFDRALMSLRAARRWVMFNDSSNDGWEHRQATVGMAMGPVAVCAAVLAYSMQPLIKFANPGGLFLSGTLLGGGIMTMTMRYIVAPGRRLAMIISCLLTMGGVIGMTQVFVNAERASEVFDAACKVIEEQVYAEKPWLRSPPETFEAFGCRPQMLDPPSPGRTHARRS